VAAGTTRARTGRAARLSLAGRARRGTPSGTERSRAAAYSSSLFWSDGAVAFLARRRCGVGRAEEGGGCSVSGGCYRLKACIHPTFGLAGWLARLDKTQWVSIAPARVFQSDGPEASTYTTNAESSARRSHKRAGSWCRRGHSRGKMAWCDSHEPLKGSTTPMALAAPHDLSAGQRCRAERPPRAPCHCPRFERSSSSPAAVLR
jgi:hypothetical protein